MQIIGFVLLGFIIWFGFLPRDQTQISAFDLHAAVMVLVGSSAAVLVSSSTTTAWRTLTCLRELIPGLRVFRKNTAEMEGERQRLCALWREGKRNEAVNLVERSRSPALKQMLDLILRRAPVPSTAHTFLELRHGEIGHWQPSIHNWEMLSKLGPAFGMVGTITGMIQLFQNMSSEDLNIGAAMSLALLATLYGVAFGAGVAGPIGNYLNNLLDERLGFLERCEVSVNEIVSRDNG